MSGSGGREGHKSTWSDLARRTQELADDSRRVREKVIDTAESVRQSHERVADTMDRLADNGGKNAPHRRRSAAMSRRFAEDEARQITALRAGLMGDRVDRAREGAEPETD
jgi:hypothetical protein